MGTPRTPVPADLPDDVRRALGRGDKITAIKLLRSARGMGLREAKESVEAALAAGIAVPPPRPSARRDRRRIVVGTLVVLAGVWAAVNLVDVAASLIVLAHRDGYEATTFAVTEVRYRHDDESGLLWGLAGTVHALPARLYAPRLVDERNPSLDRLRALFPPGRELPVWHNPRVTDVLFQKRSLQVLPYTPDLAAAERARLGRWVRWCLVPLVFALLLRRGIPATRPAAGRAAGPRA